MTELCIDCETTTHNKGSPFDRRNVLCCISVQSPALTGVFEPNRNSLARIQGAIDGAETLIGFNIKFDLHWLRRAGLTFEGKRVYDPQVAEFVLSGQTHKYPSLNDCSEKYLGLRKIDEVAALWDAGVQTTDIPWETLAKYAAEDCNLTVSVADKQRSATPDSLKRLVALANHDLLVLEEMEWNGLKFDRGLSQDKAADLGLKIIELRGKHDFLHNIPTFNWSSNDHLSALLYGGEVTEVVKVPVGHFKTGARAGQIKFQNQEKVHHLPRLFTPPKGSMKEKGTYSVDEETLASLSGKKKELISDLVKIKKMQKEISTYLDGLPKKQDEGHYSDYIYGKFNQCVAGTGRLSSSGPNLQNLSEEAGRCLITRF